MEPEPFRPPPRSSPGTQALDWIRWFGWARLLLAAASVLLVGVGAFFLFRAPAPPTEATLPHVVPSTTSVAEASPTPATAPGTAAASVVVHVAGAVLEPGVYVFATGERVEQALQAAGGVTEEADPDALNLAAPLVDGSRVYVPIEGEEVPPEVASAGEPTAAGPVDVNAAPAEVLEELPGIGPTLAAAIVSERDRGGPFATVDDLERVPGIGPAKLGALRDLVTT